VQVSAMCQTAFALVPACDEHGVPSRLSGRLVGSFLYRIREELTVTREEPRVVTA